MPEGLEESKEPTKLDGIVDNAMQVSAWIRVIFMLAFAIVLYLVIAPVILVLMIVQALFVIITGNSNLRFLGAALSKYIFQVLEFLSYNSNTKPFPFSDFPKVDNDEFNPPSAAKKEAGDTSSVKKKAPSRKASRKKAAPKKAAAKQEQSESFGDGATDKGPE